MTTAPLAAPTVPEWKLTTCLLCGAAAGHTPTCPAGIADASDFLTEALPDGAGTRTWVLAGLRFNATPARRAAFTTEALDLAGGLRWHHAVDNDRVPASWGWLLEAIVPQLGIGRYLARYAFAPLGILTVPDCGCTDYTRCRHDFPDHPFRNEPADFWPGFAPFVLRLRQSTGWWDWWMVDTGMGAVAVCMDDITNDPQPVGVTRACAMGWCHKCPGSSAPRIGETLRRPCTHACGHSAATIG
jgi:hypothetical protein